MQLVGDGNNDSEVRKMRPVRGSDSLVALAHRLVVSGSGVRERAIKPDS
ncbi:MAG: hypothetical protein MUF00_17560 [Gemmatimonadaceae bacterium]|jgi:hypothetical protein|nr:hypothetical protein [Gemmatimonadaceae bacterium]